MIFKSRAFKCICILLAGILLLPQAMHIVSAAEEEKTVRVGYMTYDGFQHGGEGEPKSGSAYEYYQKIRSYTGWKYEYVYGSVSDIFEMLEKGEVDIMAVATYTEERAKKYLYSTEPHGSEAYFLYTHEDSDDIKPANLKTLEGKSVGVTLSSYQEQYFRDWCKENGITCNIVSYEYMEDMRADLTNKKIDATVDVRILGTRSEERPWKSIYRFTSEELYFIVNKDRPDILKELNDAQAYIVSADEYFGYNVMQKYHDGVNYYNIYLNSKQKKYLESVDTINVGYLEGTNPLSFTDANGKMTGLCAEYLEAMSEAYNITFETQVYKNENSLIKDLTAGKLDIILPMGMGYWAAEEAGIALSTSIYSLPMTAVYKEIDFEKHIGSVAVIANSPTQEGYVQQFYPDVKIVYVENTKEALEAVEEGRADCYFVRSSSMDYMNSMFHIYDNFRTMSVPNNMEAFMATRIGDTTLSIILDKGISLLSGMDRDSAKLRYEFELGKVSLWEAILDNWEIVVITVIMVILVCIVLISTFQLSSNKKHMKMLMLERDKAAKAEQAKTEFLSQMSHDIRTPMNAIIGFTNFIKEEDNIEIIKEDYVPKIEMASNHLVMLINDVLEMSRIDTGKLVFKRNINDIEDIIDSVVTVMRMQAEEKKLRLVKEISVRDRILNCDQNQMSRVILNLLSNAIKFTPEGGEIHIRVTQKEKANPGFAAYEIAVSDNGIGMQPEFLKKVFEPFERERTSTISGMQGTGLGMAIVKNIVEAAGDTITVESTPDVGTTFTIHTQLMLADAKELDKLRKKDMSEKHHSIAELKSYFTNKRILLVEDNEFNSTIAYAILENAGFLVETAENGEEAVHSIVKAPSAGYYDVVLMDVQMPVMNGYEATRAIRALKDERSKVKIIAVTANAFESDKEDAREAGMDAHVSKPLDVDVLYQTLLDLNI